VKDSWDRYQKFHAATTDKLIVVSVCITLRMIVVGGKKLSYSEWFQKLMNLDERKESII
jgi:hypothetical protein